MSIKSYIQGKRIMRYYEIKENRDQATNEFTSKPQLITHDDIVWETLRMADDTEFIVDGEIGKNSHHTYSGLMMFDLSHTINLSDIEEVRVVDQIYRADLNAYMVHTDKVVNTEDAFGSEDVRNYYGDLVKVYNDQKISKDKKLSTYCDVHKLVPADTDYDELKKIVYGEESIQGIKADYMLAADSIGKLSVLEASTWN